MSTKKIEIKIINKKEWLDKFQQKVQPYISNEDYIHAEYLQQYAKKKDSSIEILKGKYNQDDDSILLVSIYSKTSFFNTGMIYHGRFTQRENAIYLEGKATPIYPDYIKEVIESPAPIILLAAVIYGILLDKEFLCGAVAILIFFLIFVEIDKKITIKDSEKRLMESLKSIQINCNTLRQ